MSSEDNSRFARRTALTVKPGQVEDFLQKMRSEIIPTMKSQDGIRRMYLLRSTQGARNEFVSLTLWNNKEAADSYGRSAFIRNTESIRELLDTGPNVTEFDIELHDVNAQDLPPPETAKKVVARRLRTSSGGAPRKKKTASRSKKREERRNSR
jgi:heme-degrading monooxygenase HmoA